MNRYFCLILILALCLLPLMAKPYAARIGTREYSEKELQDGFKAYLEYSKPAHPLDKADSLSYFAKYFDELIALNIYNEEIKSRKLSLSDAELEELIINNPPQGVKQIPDFLVDGVFNLEKYQQALQEEESFKREVLQVSQDMYSYHALLNAVRSEATVDEASIRQRWLNTATQADAEIIYFDYSRLREIEASPEEVRDFYENIKEKEYKKYQGRSLYYVHFTGASSRATASPEALRKAEADSRALYNLAREIGLPAAAKGLKLELKETPFFGRNDPFIRGIGREPVLIAMTFQQKPGAVMEPYKNAIGDIFVIGVAREQEIYFEDFEPLAQIMQLRANSQKRAARNREIFAAFEARYSPDEYLEAARRDSLTIVRQSGITKESSFPPIGKVEVLNNAILSTPLGSFTEPVEFKGMYYLARVLARTLPLPEDWENVRESVLSQARKAVEEEYLDSWFLGKKAELKIKYPPELVKVPGF